uniref:uncharacterized protein LOC122605493 n=1 Tax=Erigeron canadensis TaxID=72917 RepID=UPI001CB990FF|nr:uncharacterized protein LOC122605493 [Erigeron canadensis]
MFRAMSTKKNRGGYSPLVNGKVPVDDITLGDPKMNRCNTLPSNVFGESVVPFGFAPSTPVRVIHAVEKEVKKASKMHPIFAIFERRSRKKKATAKPEFARYMQYLKEGGSWNANSSRPVIY